MRKVQLAFALALAMVAAAAIVEAQGKPDWVPVGPPDTPVGGPETPPADPPDSVLEFVCSIVAIPHLCD